MRLVSEPTAAAIAYGLDKGDGPLKRCFIFDFGGGTFDVSILNIEHRRITVLAVGGDTHLGGQDIDNALTNYCIEEFEKQFPEIDLSLDKRAKAFLRKKCS